ncbi:MAG: NAD-dependent epimerase/dehydratase family protein [Burkholderiales bacterium]
MKGNILVTGGAGFIGARLVFDLVKKHPNSKLWVLDNLHPQVHGIEGKFPNFGENVTCVRGDVTDSQTMRHLVREAQPLIVYHLAAETGTGQSYDEVTRYCQVNVVGTAQAIEALRQESTVTRRVVLAGSRAVYGEGAYQDKTGREFVGLPRKAEAMAKGDFSVPLPSDCQPPAKAIPSHSGLRPAPASVYASTKLMQEYLLRQSGEGSPWRAIILRFQNVYGPGQSLRNAYTGVLSIFCEQLLSGQRLEIFEDGGITRDFVFVDDVVSALVRAGQKDLPHGIVLDIGSGKPITILETARILIEALRCSQDQLSISGRFRIGDIRYACADIRFAQEQLGWEPNVGVRAGLQQLAAWASAQHPSPTSREGQNG